MRVYWESVVWSIIANRVVYVKYKNVYKAKVFVLNCNENSNIHVSVEKYYI